MYQRRCLRHIWFFNNLHDKTEISCILIEIEKEFRKQNGIVGGASLNRTQRRRLRDFENNVCHVIGKIYEFGSLIIHGEVAMQLFTGELERLNVFGSSIDPYVLPFLRAVVPIIDPDVPPATFHPVP